MLRVTAMVVVLAVILSGAIFAEDYVVWGVGAQASIDDTAQPTVIRSGDTGASWSYVGRDGQLAAVDYYGLAAIDSQTTWIAGCVSDGYGTLYRTNDSGSTWTRIGMNNPLFEGIDLGKMQIVGDDMWVMGSDASSQAQYLYHSSDNGTTWANILPETYRTANSFQGISVASNGTIWLSGGAADHLPVSPLIIKSTDDGATWTPSALSGDITELAYVLDVTALDSTTAWATGRGTTAPVAGQIIATTDGGTTWTIQNSSDAVDGNNILALDENVVWAVYDSSLVRTIDGGENWEIITETAGDFTMALTAVSEDIAFCADDASSLGGAGVYWTTDGGENINEITQIDDLDIVGIWQMDMVPVPEPATVSLLALGTLAVLRQKRKK